MVVVVVVVVVVFIVVVVVVAVVVVAVAVAVVVVVVAEVVFVVVDSPRVGRCATAGVSAPETAGTLLLSLSWFIPSQLESVLVFVTVPCSPPSALLPSTRLPLLSSPLLASLCSPPSALLPSALLPLLSSLRTHTVDRPWGRGDRSCTQAVPHTRHCHRPALT